LFIDKSHQRVPANKPLLLEARQRYQDFSLHFSSWGCVASVDREGRTIWIVDAHRGDGKRFVVRAEEKLTAFVELESAIRLARSGRTMAARERDAV
jgi:hypothetical protein